MARRRRRRQEMQEWFRRRDREGWTLRELAARAGMPVGTIGWWAHELRKKERAARAPETASGFSLLVTGEESDEVTREDPSPPIRIRLPGGTELELARGVDTEDLARVVEVLQRRR